MDRGMTREGRSGLPESEFGNVTLIEEGSRDVWRLRFTTRSSRACAMVSLLLVAGIEGW